MIENRLYKHQFETFKFGIKKGSFADLSDCGTGKTIAAISIVYYRVNENPSFKVLVVAPKSILNSGWAGDIEKAFPELSEKYVIVTGTKVQKLGALNNDKNIYITNYETLNQFDWDDAGFDMIIFDEAVKLKNPKTNWTKKAIRLARQTRFKIIISGLITPNDLQEVYAPFDIISPQILGKSFWSFRSKYFTPNPFSYQNREWIAKKNADKAIMAKVQPFIIRHDKNQVLNLPDKVHSIRETEMGKEQLKVYKEMEKDLIVLLEDETVKAVSKGILLQKLSQISSGFVYNEEKQAIWLDNAKLKEMKEMLDSDLRHEQVLIFYNYQAEVDLFKKEFPDSAFITGGQNTSEQEQMIKDFKNGNKRLMFASIKAAKYGLTFVNTHYTIYFSLNYSLDDVYQSQNRTDRIGQTKTVFYYYLLNKKSVDYRIYNAIIKKQSLNDLILDLIDEINQKQERKAQ